ncbi:hypothetical protein ACFL1X_05360 [Candidatus Hydrogenedentota bacterium]
MSYLSFLPDSSDSYEETLSKDRPRSELDVITEGIGGTSAGKDPLDEFFLGKKVFLAKSVEDIVGLIHERGYLKDENVRKIDYDMCKTKSMLFELGDWQMGADPQFDKTRVNIERELAMFEREKRMEDVNCWRDVCRLKSDLRELMQQVEQENRKQSLLFPK